MTTTTKPVLTGVQTPRVCTAPESVGTAGGEAIELAASVGLVLDPWQELSVRVILGEREDGNWSAFETGELVARQNGKGGIIECLELAGLFLFDEYLIMHSAHEFKTAQEGFLRIKELIDGSDELRKLVSRVRTAHGDEGIELRTGQRLRFVARSRSSGRGFSGDRLIMDEAQELPFMAIRATLPTMRAMPNPQINYFGTVPNEQNDCEVWTSVRDRGRAGTSKRLAWLEWSPEEQVDEDGEAVMPDLDDRRVWAQTNPGMGYRITEEAMENERDAMAADPKGFAAELLSWWPSGSTTDHVIKPATWAVQARPDGGVVTGEGLTIAVDTTPDRSRTAIAICGASLSDPGLSHVEIVDERQGTGWVVARLVELVGRWDPLVVVLDPAGPAGSFISKLANAGIEVEEIGGRQLAQACGSFKDSVTDRLMVHYDQPVLSASVDGARKRPLADAWAWHRKSVAVNIAPLVAATLALDAWYRHRQDNTSTEPEIW